MADIDVVPKRRTNMWLWVVLAIVVVAILWMAFANRSAPRTGWNIDRSAPIATLAAHAPHASLSFARG